jgi:hypothetical protein
MSLRCVAFTTLMSCVTDASKQLLITDLFWKKSFAHRYYSNLFACYFYRPIYKMYNIHFFSCVAFICNAVSQLSHLFPTIPSEMMDRGLTSIRVYMPDSPFMKQQFQHTEKSLFIVPLVWSQTYENQLTKQLYERYRVSHTYNVKGNMWRNFKQGFQSNRQKKQVFWDIVSLDKKFPLFWRIVESLKH